MFRIGNYREEGGALREPGGPRRSVPVIELAEQAQQAVEDHRCLKQWVGLIVFSPVMRPIFMVRSNSKSAATATCVRAGFNSPL